ncbi:prenyltransferase [Salipaludibacillus sp. CUR1]|uniref:prenyltransferase n=1 Tax=Salipaludibacillus sp. CUR1 TaxID=2820003 RepID=UPI001E36A36B|nr:prenyltransferase [Salipaludibacillus sp. CUR1]MCE7792856.1 prenyltransferase [Salipaludibacillus sp. CUR1]
MSNKVMSIFHKGWKLLRAMAVISSSAATIVSAMLPLFLYYPVSTGYAVSLFIILNLAAFTMHGVLTHAFNDYTDYRSGTDQYSPAMLSGGSRVIQEEMISHLTLLLIGKWLSIILVGLAGILAVFGLFEMAVLLLIGVWAAVSYSLPPLRFSYRPFLGEWLSLFPSILFVGFAGAWIALDHIPVWAMQNALINALFCLAWVMVHHIPDLEADHRAVPAKRTSVVWFTYTFGLYYARFPALLYLIMTGLCAFWLGFDRLWAAGGVVVFVSIAVFLVLKMNVTDHEQVTSYEKIMLILAMITAVWLGVFI